MRLRHFALGGMIMGTCCLAEMSSCARSCYSAVATFLNCNPSNITCACEQQPSLIFYAEPCLTQECRQDDLLLALTAMKDLCTEGATGHGSGGGPGTDTVLPPATQTPTGSFTLYKIVAPPEPTTIPGKVITSGSVTRTIEPITVKAQQPPSTVTPAGSSSSSGSSVGNAGSTETQGSNSHVAWRVEVGAVMLMCVALGAVYVW